MGKVLQNYPPVLTQGYGENGHIGIDVTGNDQGTHVLDYIVSFAAGTVVEIRTDSTGFEPNGSYGNYVLLDHGNGYRTRYAHMANGTLKVTNGEKVDAGKVLGYMGATGTAYGGHLHFEIIQNGGNINPFDYVFKGKEFSANEVTIIGTPVARDSSVNQLEVLVDNLFVRENHGTNYNSKGFIKQGIYNYSDTFQDSNYIWYKILNGWIANQGDWLKIFPKNDVSCQEKIKELEFQIQQLKEQLNNENQPLFIYEAKKEANYWIHLKEGDCIYYSSKPS